MVSLSFIAAAAGVAGLTSALDFPIAVPPPDSPLQYVNISEFAGVIKENPLVMVEFFAPWCPHSRMLMPRLNSVADRLKDLEIPVVQVDCSQYGVLCDQQMIKFYPTLKIYKNHRLNGAETYRGKQTVDEMYEYLSNLKMNPISTINSESQLQEMSQDSDLPIVYNAGFHEADEALKKVALDLSEQFHFVSDSREISAPRLEVHFPSEKRIAILEHSDVVDEKRIREWLMMEKLPFFASIGQEQFKDYMATNLPIGYFFYGNEQELQNNTEFFTELGKKYRGSINFAGLDANKFGEHMKVLNVKPQIPMFVLHNVKNNLKYTINQLSDEEYKNLDAPMKLDTEAVTQLIKDFKAGQAQPIVVSEPIPENQENAKIVKLVGKTHDEFVYNNDKDVFVKYYAPWCQHSKAFSVIMEKLADTFAADPETKSKFAFAEVDSTANDIVSFPVADYPTLALYPAGSQPGSQPIVFDGSRTEENIIEFIKINSKNHIDAKAVEAHINEAKERSKSEAEASSRSEAEKAEAEAKSKVEAEKVQEEVVKEEQKIEDEL
ncbi:Protein disulfide-isomerase EUG1 [Nakaseomyces bracarensis]|uniref:protein disulfide-isomerase n=1 Tax=Nakaseomyces bracarensis TaxID=273131 RepID=A0ABR4NTU1_9SACH